MVPARYAEAAGDSVRCLLCPHFCLVRPGKAGRCLGRVNADGVLQAATYGEVVSMGMDPIEKKPLYHFHPGSEILSVATYGCNLACPFCQNWEIAQRRVPTRSVSPGQLVGFASEHGSIGVAFTYTEPLVWFEYVLESCRLLHGAGMKTVLVTNGLVNPGPLAELLPVVDAMNIDLKSMRHEFYRDYVKGDLEVVLGTIRAARASCHLELTALLIPGRNDGQEELEELVGFAAGLGRDTVLHFSRYFPRNRSTEPPTSNATLMHAAEVARAKLDYVYIGNASLGEEFRDTFCPDCGRKLIDRSDYAGRPVGIEQGKCAGCRRPVDVVL